MIAFHRVTVPNDPSAARRAVKLLTEVFGQDEGELEWQQLSGSELAHNRDVLFYAEQDGRMIGACHMTVCLESGHGGLSGICVLPECRGGGVGRALIKMAIDAFDETGGEYLYLGTNNPIAARMYRGFGFAFEAGSNVMYRTKGLSLLPLYGKGIRPGCVEDACASLRIGVIPLALRRGGALIKDANAGLADNAILTQVSCMGLYPRYLSILQRGGAVKLVKDETTRLPVALGSMLISGDRRYVDAFGVEEARGVLQNLLVSLCGEGTRYMRIFDGDAEKQALAASVGFVPEDEAQIAINGLTLPCHNWRRG